MYAPSKTYKELTELAKDCERSKETRDVYFTINTAEWSKARLHTFEKYTNLLAIDDEWKNYLNDEDDAYVKKTSIKSKQKIKKKFNLSDYTIFTIKDLIFFGVLTFIMVILRCFNLVEWSWLTGLIKPYWVNAVILVIGFLYIFTKGDNKDEDA